MNQAKKTTSEFSHVELRDLHHKRAKKLNRIVYVFLSLFITILLAVTYVTYQKDRQSLPSGINSLRQTLGQQNESVKPQTISSSTGFSVTYDTNTIVANGIIYPEFTSNPSLYNSGTGPTNIETGTNLIVSRAYVAVNFWTASFQKKYNLALNKNPNYQMQLLTSQMSNVFAIGRKDYGSNLSDTEIAIKLFAPKTIVSSYATIIPSLSSQTTYKVGTISYQKLLYKMTNTTFSAASYIEIQYIVVENGRPYVIKLDITPTTMVGDIALLNQVLSNIKYTKPDPNIFATSEIITSSSITTNLARQMAVTASSTTALPSNSVNLPSKLSSNSLKIVADNQPSVVRVGTINCFNFNLLLPNGKSALSVQNACSGGSGSGSIVSSNGYISTNGHVVIFSPSDAYQLYIVLAVNSGNVQVLKDYLQYLVDTNVATVTQVNALIAAIESGDTTADQTLLDLTSNIPEADYQVTSESQSYAIQLSNVPIRFITQGTNISFEYNKYVVPAKLVAKNFDINSLNSNQINLNTYASTDVALLKIAGNNYPIITLGNINDVQVNSNITAVGWPGFVDGGLTTTDSRTIPTATAGSVLQITKQPSGAYQVIVTSVPIAEGNSGGPAFDDAGQEIGITTYVASSANPSSGITQESTGGILRNINDFKELLTSSGITLNTISPVTTLWQRVIYDFTIGHFKDAYKTSIAVQNLYPENYLAVSFESAAKIQISDGNDTSAPSRITLIGEIIIPIVFAGSAITLIEILRHRRHGKSLGYYNYPLDEVASPYLSGSRPSTTSQIATLPITEDSNTTTSTGETSLVLLNPISEKEIPAVESKTDIPKNKLSKA